MSASRRPARSALYAAFNTTAVATLFLVCGLIGYSLSHGFLEGTWTGHIVWWEIRLGVLFAVLAIYFWRKSLRLLA